jgi:chromate transporter
LTDPARPEAEDPGPRDVPGAPSRPASPVDLFLAFNRLALQGFGGVLPVAQRELVERRGWLTRQEFVQLLSIGQVLPGPNIFNMALIFGDRLFGWRGGAAALAGLLAAPLLIVLALTLLAREAAHLPQVAGALRGMGMVAAALILSTGLKVVVTLRRNAMGLAACAALAAATVLAVGVLRWPMVLVLAGVGPLAWGIAWWRLGR